MTYDDLQNSDYSLQLTTSNPADVRKAAWKAYFFGLLVTNIIMLFIPWVFMFAFRPPILIVIDVLDVILGFTALYGYAWKRKIFNRLFWILFVILSWLYTFFGSMIYFSLTGEIDPMEGYGKGMTDAEVFRQGGVMLMLLIAHIPAFVANILYAFRAKTIWQKDFNTLGIERS
jgi:hypothetical protein